ncbi:hypothetical protein MPER_02665 [Moniliophthora perniciosa FA553]|nr:hypothetical protein MPER_02665 [Moniliophthora perniciosa FA553]
MSARIRALEDALAIMQAAVSSDRHPLLEDDLLKIKFGAETLGEGKRSDEVMSPAEELAEASAATSSGDTKAAAEKVDTTALDTLGTLTLDEEGELKYFGRSAGTNKNIPLQAGEEYLEEDGVGSESDLQTASTPETFTSPASDALPPEIYALAAGTSSLSPGPNSPESSSQVGQDTLQSLLTHLPPRDRGTVLAQSYIDHATIFSDL